MHQDDVREHNAARCALVCVSASWAGPKNMGQLRAQKGMVRRVAQVARTDASVRARDEGKSDPN